MKHYRWQILIVLLTLALVGVLLLTRQPSLTPTVVEPASGGVYTEALIGSFSRLNPLYDLANPADRDVNRLIFSSLFRFDSRGVPQPDLVESWGVSADGTVYNLTLRPNLLWHDGQPLTTEDVLFTLDVLRSQFSAYTDDVRALWDSVEITVLDGRNIKFVLQEPFAPFLDYLTFGVLPKHLLSTTPPDQMLLAEFNFSPVGSGPYRFEKLLVEDNRIAGVVLTRFDGYYGAKPFIEQIVFRYYPDAASALAAYRNGDVLGISQITLDVLPEALQEPNLAFYSSRMPRLTMVLFNLQNDEVRFLQDKSIRRALLLALNRQWIIDRYLQGQGIVADSPLLPDTWAYYNGVERLPYDPEAAAALLKKAGYVLPADGTVRVGEEGRLSFTLLHPDTVLHAALADAIRDHWAAVGVEVTLQAVPYSRLIEDYLATHRYQVALVDFDLTRAYDPDPYPFWHQAEIVNGQNYAQWDNRSASEYLEQARVITEPDTRARLYRNFQVVFARELPALPLFYPVYTYAVDTRVLGVQVPLLFEPADRFNNIARWYLITRRALEQTQQAQPTP
ncbi:MAG: peptide ABC transporter substrate-binding protein [Anaerolineales bacterium]|nr:peptide ABC transporter substrate-binding protein [Anaerolineales bacterium]